MMFRDVAFESFKTPLTIPYGCRYHSQHCVPNKHEDSREGPAMGWDQGHDVTTPTIQKSTKI